ncbi:MAG: hypothetical protein KDB79_08495 [Acidobacteria bacterium]|nr:hypothetical protein [Acidobacteriota bacterium]
MDNDNGMMALLKLYELRRDTEMRKARAWYLTEFSPESAMDIINLYRDGERASANFRMVVSYWDMAASFVINGGIDEKLFFGANGEHIFVYAKIEPFLEEVREIFREPDFFINLETLCKRMPNYEQKLEGRKRLAELWKTAG